MNESWSSEVVERQGSSDRIWPFRALYRGRLFISGQPKIFREPWLITNDHPHKDTFSALLVAPQTYYNFVIAKTFVACVIVVLLWAESFRGFASARILRSVLKLGITKSGGILPALTISCLFGMSHMPCLEYREYLRREPLLQPLLHKSNSNKTTRCRILNLNRRMKDTERRHSAGSKSRQSRKGSTKTDVSWGKGPEMFFEQREKA